MFAFAGKRLSKIIISLVHYTFSAVERQTRHYLYDSENRAEYQKLYLAGWLVSLWVFNSTFSRYSQ